LSTEELALLSIVAGDPIAHTPVRAKVAPAGAGVDVPL